MAYAYFILGAESWMNKRAAVATETNWRRSNAALPQTKNGRADLPVSLNIRDAQQSVPPGQPFCPWLRTSGGLRQPVRPVTFGVCLGSGPLFFLQVGKE